MLAANPHWLMRYLTESDLPFDEDLPSAQEFAAWLKESNMAVRKEVDRYVFNGVTMLSETEFKDDVCQTDEMHAEFVVGDEPLMLNAKDFIIDSPRSPKDRSISRKAFDCLKAAGFSDFKEEYPADEYLCKVTMTFHGWMLFERK